jgi:hypothetical protein
MARDWPRQKNIHWLVTRYRPPPPPQKVLIFVTHFVPRKNVTINLVLVTRNSSAVVEVSEIPWSETGRPVAWDEAFLYHQAFLGSEEDFKTYFQFPYKQLVLKICLVDF